MRKEYLPGKHGLHDLREALFLRAKLTLTPEQQTELDSLYVRLDRLTAAQVVDMISGALNGGLPLRPERREAIPSDETWQAERARREREERTF